MSARRMDPSNYDWQINKALGKPTLILARVTGNVRLFTVMKSPLLADKFLFGKKLLNLLVYGVKIFVARRMNERNYAYEFNARAKR